MPALQEASLFDNLYSINFIHWSDKTSSK